ncbi:MAG: DMT family transporter [Pseudomonadota bacterium]
MALTENTRGALWMMASMAGFVFNDAMMKTLSETVPLFQAIFVRGLFATALICTLALHRGAFSWRLRAPDRMRVGGRLLCEMATTCLFLTALFNMPIANAVAIVQVSSLGVTLAAALFLGDAVGWRRYGAIGIGFVGVLLIVRPGTEGFNIYSLSAIGAVFGIVLRDLITRRLSPDVPGLSVTVMTSITITLLGATVTAMSPWVPMPWSSVATLGAGSVCLLVGYYAGVEAMRVGEVGAVSPFRYTNLIWALILSVAVFGDVPDFLTMLGAGIIVASGIYTLHREQVRSQPG